MKRLITLIILSIGLCGCVSVYKMQNSNDNIITHAGIEKVPASAIVGK